MDDLSKKSIHLPFHGLMNTCEYPELCPWKLLLWWQALKPAASLKVGLDGQTCKEEMAMVPFISNRTCFLKSLANFPVRKFPRLFLQTFHFLERSPCFSENNNVSQECGARWFSLYIGSRCSVDESPGQAWASFWSRKCSFLEVINLHIILKLVPLGLAGRCWLSALFGRGGR